MAIEKSDAQVQSLSVKFDEGGVARSVTAKVNYLLADSGTEITRVVVDVAVSNATSGELTAAASLVSKAAALAVV
jgi:hypothetical protein